MREYLARSTGVRLGLDDYVADFDRHFWNIDASGFWKIERRQSFREPGVASWEAFARGDWDASLRLLADQHDHYREYLGRIADHGFALHRVRVVEEPVTPYLQWELHLLRLKEQHGENTRVVGPDEVRAHETEGPLPEVVVLGTAVLYEIRYDENGVLAGGVRHTDPDTIASCQRFIRTLHGSGERLASFFERRIAHLPPPTPTPTLTPAEPARSSRP